MSQAIPETSVPDEGVHLSRYNVPCWRDLPVSKTYVKPEAPGSVVKRIAVLVSEVEANQRGFIREYDNLVDGDHDRPYSDVGDSEHEDRMRRSVTNFMPLAISTVTQEMVVDGFGIEGESGHDEESWARWQEMRMDFMLRPLLDGVGRYGYSFLECRHNDPTIRDSRVSAFVHSPKFATAAFRRRHDIVPAHFLYLDDRWGFDSDDLEVSGWYFDGTHRYRFRSEKSSSGRMYKIEESSPHVGRTMPIVRVCANIDANGVARSLLDGLKPHQDKINQVWFDTLTNCAKTANAVRFLTGIKPEFIQEEYRKEDGSIALRPKLDDYNNKMPAPVTMSPGAIVTTPNDNANAFSLGGSDMGGYHGTMEIAVQHLAAASQIPPHHTLGKIANLSAEALRAARGPLVAKVDTTKVTVGESLEQFQLIAAEISGRQLGDERHRLECRWRSFDAGKGVMTADEVLKLRDAAELHPDAVLEATGRFTQTEIARFSGMREEHQEMQVEQQLAMMKEEAKVMGNGPANSGPEEKPGKSST